MVDCLVGRGDDFFMNDCQGLWLWPLRTNIMLFFSAEVHESCELGHCGIGWPFRGKYFGSW